MSGFEQIEHVGGMSEQDGEPAGNLRRDAPHIGSMGGRIVKTDDGQLAGGHGDEEGLVDQ